MSDEATLRSRVEHGELEAGLVIPDGFSAALRDPASGTVELRYLGTTTALAQGLRAPIEAAVAPGGGDRDGRADRRGRGRRHVRRGEGRGRGRVRRRRPA